MRAVSGRSKGKNQEFVNEISSLNTVKEWLNLNEYIHTWKNIYSFENFESFNFLEYCDLVNFDYTNTKMGVYTRNPSDYPSIIFS